MLPPKPSDWNEALVWPQPDTPEIADEARLFEVTGVQAVDDDNGVTHQPGEQFLGVIAPERLALLTQGGAVRLIVPESLDDLRGKAKDLDIKGRSKMDVDELKQAILQAEQDQVAIASVDPAERQNPTVGSADTADQAGTADLADPGNESVLAQDQPQEG